MRSFGIGGQILADLGVHEKILLRASKHHAIGGVGDDGLYIVDEMLIDAAAGDQAAV